MKALLIALAASAIPLPVTSVGGTWNSDGSITLNWTLPVDPSITGIRIFRERLDAFDEVIFEIVGLAASYTDTSTHRDRSYRYWIQTKNAGGELSDAVFIEFISNDTRGHWTCWATAGAGPPPEVPLLIALALLRLAVARRRVRK